MLAANELDSTRTADCVLRAASSLSRGLSGCLSVSSIRVVSLRASSTVQAAMRHNAESGSTSKRTLAMGKWSAIPSLRMPMIAHPAMGRGARRVRPQRRPGRAISTRTANLSMHGSMLDAISSTLSTSLLRSSLAAIARGHPASRAQRSRWTRSLAQTASFETTMTHMFTLLQLSISLKPFADAPRHRRHRRHRKSAAPACTKHAFCAASKRLVSRLLFSRNCGKETR
jgi:hypothetical protein